MDQDNKNENNWIDYYWPLLNINCYGLQTIIDDSAHKKVFKIGYQTLLLQHVRQAAKMAGKPTGRGMKEITEYFHTCEWA